MNNTTNLGNEFVTKLKEKATNFNNWMSVSTALVNAKHSFNKTTNLKKTEIKSVDAMEIDLAKEGIDVSKWEESVKPVKVIMSVVQKDNGENTSIEIGNMVMLMEDGTFESSKDEDKSVEKFIEALSNPDVKNKLKNIILDTIRN